MLTPRRALSLSALLVSALLPLVPARADGLDNALGKAVFDRIWVSGGASTKSADGLGPLYNARSCAGCHSGSGGGAAVRVGPDGTLSGQGLVVRIARADHAPDPVYGRQIQTRALPGFAPEARIRLSLVPDAGRSGLDRVVIAASHWSAGEPDGATGLSVRRAPPLFGRGRIAAVDPAAIRANADPDDRDGDGIAGRVGETPDGHLGRFGWRAEEADIRDAATGAFALDLGLSTSDRPDPAGDCTDAQPACRAARSGRDGISGAFEVSDPLVDVLVTYVAGLEPASGARAALASDDAAARGAAIFAATGCAACHRPALAGRDGRPQTIYSDLLLHDMGPGLAEADGDAWRTAPLIGLSRARPSARRFLHDGRAATPEAAIGWHDGEARAARMRYQDLAAQDRADLIAFLEGL
ncbi:di-heme oxidoredictase family protein [Segnochrobactraceae bacterium EtOH-i3]